MEKYNEKGNKLFEDLFVMEIANNHWGSLERGYRLIDVFGKVARYNNVKAAIKLQIRDVDNFIHKDFKNAKNSRYITKTISTKMTKDDHAKMVKRIKNTGCIPMATAFDERSVDWAVDIGCEIMKVASSDINDWFLLQKLASVRLPVLISTGGSSLKDIDDVVAFFSKRDIPIALNHCVSNYPSEDWELELNQIDFLKNRYPGLVIGHSTHEYHDWTYSMLISYAKGARSWERHVDLPYSEGEAQKEVSKYCSLPHQMDEYFKAFHKVKQMSGGSCSSRRIIEGKEKEYLDALIRGIYVKGDLKKGHPLTVDDIYSAAPLQKGQLSSREFMEGDVLTKDIKAHAPLSVDDVLSDYLTSPLVKNKINNRGM